MEPREKAAQLPENPGVYLFKDAGGTVLYVGKARNLRSRVRSYFLESRWIDAKTGSLAREIADLETIVVGNEREALPPAALPAVLHQAVPGALRGRAHDGGTPCGSRARCAVVSRRAPARLDQESRTADGGSGGEGAVRTGGRLPRFVAHAGRHRRTATHCRSAGR